MRGLTPPHECPKNQSTHFFLISKTFIGNARLKLAKNYPKAKNTLRLNFRYLKFIHFLDYSFYRVDGDENKAEK